MSFQCIQNQNKSKRFIFIKFKYCQKIVIISQTRRHHRQKKNKFQMQIEPKANNSIPNHSSSNQPAFTHQHHHKNPQSYRQTSHHEESQSIGKPVTNLEKFLETYNKFMLENPTVELNPHIVISDISLNILEPPRLTKFNNADERSKIVDENHQNELKLRQKQSTSLETLDSLYERGKNLPFLLDPKENYLHETVSSIKRLKEEKIFETLGWIEQLNLKLNKEYESEVNRGISNGIYSHKIKSKEKEKEKEKGSIGSGGSIGLEGSGAGDSVGGQCQKQQKMHMHPQSQHQLLGATNNSSGLGQNVNIDKFEEKKSSLQIQQGREKDESIE